MNPFLRHCRATILILAMGLSLYSGFPAAAANARQKSVLARLFVHKNGIDRSPAPASGTQTPSRPDLIIVQTQIELPGTLSRRFPKGSQLLLKASNGRQQILTPDFFAAADLRISFDGARVLFAGKKTKDLPWQVWEMNVDGTGARQVTHSSSDCIQPAYLARGLIVYTAMPSTTPAQSASITSGESQIWVSKLDGTDAHPITFGPGDFQVQTVLQNGAILATARTPLLPSNGHSADRELYTIRLDGTSLATLRCDHQNPAVRSQAEELADGSVVFVKAPLNSNNLGGQLAWIRRGAVHNEPLTAPTIQAKSPQPIPGEQIIISREATGAQPGKSSTLYAFNPTTGKFGAPIFQDPKFASVEAVPVAAHESPRWYWSTLNADLKRGYFICLNGYLAQDLPRGRIAAKLAKVRVLTLDAATQKENLLGEAPMEEDGSFYIAVPPDQPVRFEVVNAAGQVVREQKSWIWARSGEEHGCVGCHEDRAIAPENRWPMALRRFDTPTRLDLAKATVGSGQTAGGR